MTARTPTEPWRAICPADDIITSRANPRVRWLRSLRDRKDREQTGLLFVPDLRLAIEAESRGARIRLAVVTPEADRIGIAAELSAKLVARGAPMIRVSAEVFESISDRDEACGIGVVIEQQWETLERIRPSHDLCWVALEGVQYPGNLGTILRSCDAVGVAGVILLDRTTDPHDPKAVRASLGAVFSQRLVRTDTEGFGRWARSTGVHVVGASPSAERDYRSVEYPSPLVLLMGSERNGLSARSQSHCDELVRIPMAGRCDSLNLAMAATLVLYEAFYQHARTDDLRAS